MKNLTFTIEIGSPVEKVWHTMLDKTTYQEWTKVFNPTSYYEGIWEVGAKMLFLGRDEKTGKTQGMVAKIVALEPLKFVSIQHLGMVRDGVEDTQSEFVKSWTPAHENYTFEKIDQGTRLVVDVQVADMMADEFATLWPKSLVALKQLCEK